MKHDPAFEYYKSITSPRFVELFQSSGILSALTKNELYHVYTVPHSDRKYYEDTYLVKSYTVKGRMYDEKINSFSNVEYTFKNLNDAENYYKILISTYPYSSVKLIEETYKEVRTYT